MLHFFLRTGKVHALGKCILISFSVIKDTFSTLHGSKRYKRAQLSKLQIIAFGQQDWGPGQHSKQAALKQDYQPLPF
jgi:hypothetical protein